MRAILVCTGIPALSKPDREGVCSPLSPLLDRPFLHHVIESIMDLGVREIHFVLHEGSDLLELLLGTGQRWGGAFVYHELPSERPVYSRLSDLLRAAEKEELILVAHADRLPVIDRKLVEKPLSPAFLLGSDEVTDPIGWALVTYEMLTQVAGDPDEYACFARWREQARTTARFYRMPQPLAANSFPQLLKAHGRVLHKHHTGLVLTGREVKTGIWVGRNVSVHRTAKLVAPVYVAENCRIGPQAQLGPGVSVGKGSVIDRCSILENSVVYPGSYVGEGLEVRDAIIRGSHLVNIRLGAELHDVDEILLSEVRGLPLSAWFGSLRDRFAGLVLGLVTAPVLFLLVVVKAIRFGVNPLEAEEFVVQPTVRHPERWSTFRQWGLRSKPGAPKSENVRAHFVNVFLPGLWNVARGHLALVGQAPVTVAEASHLAEDERGTRLRQRVGLIHPQVANAGATRADRGKRQNLLIRYLSALSAGMPVG